MKRSLLFVTAMLLGASCTFAVGLHGQRQDSVQITTFVHCPQTAFLDSLRAHERASVARTDSLAAWLLLHMPSCPAIPAPLPPPSPSLPDQIAKWAPVALGVAILIAVLATRNKVERVEERIIEYRDRPDDRRAVP